MEDEPEDEEKKKDDDGAVEGVEAEPPKVEVRQPCILIFDSLAGGSKARTCQTLRYLYSLRRTIIHIIVKAYQGLKQFEMETGVFFLGKTH